MDNSTGFISYGTEGQIAHALYSLQTQSIFELRHGFSTIKKIREYHHQKSIDEIIKTNDLTRKTHPV